MNSRFKETLQLTFAALCAVLAMVLLAPSQAFAQTESLVHSFAGGTTDGKSSFAGLVIDSSGNLYGTTSTGGANNDGVVFKITSLGTFSLLHSFGTGDGINPQADLIMDSSGNLYGTTVYGGAHSRGTVFKLSESGGVWSETVLFSFAGGASDGAWPCGRLAIDSSGNIYGTASGGGTNANGTVFELSESGGVWTETTLYKFAGGTTDGVTPQGNVVIDSHGNLWGTTTYGGSHNVGIVFELAKPTPPSTTWTETVPHIFTSGTTDGRFPFNLLIDSSGNIWGTTATGGANGDGTMFEIPSGGSYSMLFSFSNGYEPEGALIIDSSGNLWGTTLGGGANGHGEVFELTESLGVWSETAVYSFVAGTSDGQEPYGGLAVDSSGNLYSTTYVGGANGFGVVFKLIP